MKTKTRVAIRVSLSRAAFLGLTAGTAAPADENGRAIIRNAAAADERNWKSARNYGFSKRVDARRLDSQGRLKSRDIKIYGVMLLGRLTLSAAGRARRPSVAVLSPRRRWTLRPRPFRFTAGCCLQRLAAY